MRLTESILLRVLLFAGVLRYAGQPLDLLVHEVVDRARFERAVLALRAGRNAAARS